MGQQISSRERKRARRDFESGKIDGETYARRLGLAGRAKRVFVSDVEPSTALDRMEAFDAFEMGDVWIKPSGVFPARPATLHLWDGVSQWEEQHFATLPEPERRRPLDPRRIVGGFDDESGVTLNADGSGRVGRIPSMAPRDDAAQDGSKGLAALMRGWNAQEEGVEHALASMIERAGWRNAAADPDALAGLLRGRDFRVPKGEMVESGNPDLAEFTAEQIESLGWHRAVLDREPLDAVGVEFTDRGIAKVWEWLGRPGVARKFEALDAPAVLMLRPYETLSGRATAVWPGSVLHRVGHLVEVLTPENPQSSVFHDFTEPEQATEDPYAGLDDVPLFTVPVTDPAPSVGALLRSLVADVEGLVLNPERSSSPHCADEYNAGVVNAANVIRAALADLGVEMPREPVEQPDFGDTETAKSARFTAETFVINLPDMDTLAESVAKHVQPLIDMARRMAEPREPGADPGEPQTD